MNEVILFRWIKENTQLKEREKDLTQKIQKLEKENSQLKEVEQEFIKTIQNLEKE